MKKRKKIRREIKFVYFLLIISLFVFILYLLLNLNSEIIYQKVIPMKLNIGEIAGFDVNNTILTFGTVTPLSSSRRQLKLENNYPFPIQFRFYAEGNISNFLVFKKKVYLNSGKSRDFDIVAFSNNETSGEYSGNFIITARRFFG
jgi:hypothetical protein